MRRLLRLATIALLAMAAFSTQSQAQPSFDCAKASTAIEHAICADTALADLDRTVALRFHGLVDRLSSKPTLVTALHADQRAAVAERDSCTGDDLNACVLDALSNRDRELKLFTLGLTGPALAIPPSFACFQENQTQMALNACVGAQAASVKRALGLANAAATERYLQAGDSDGERDFAEVEALEIRYRQAACSLEANAYEGGSIQPMIQADCEARLGWRRLVDVRGTNFDLGTHWADSLDLMSDQVNACLQTQENLNVTVDDITGEFGGPLSVRLVVDAETYMICTIGEDDGPPRIEPAPAPALPPLVVFQPLTDVASAPVATDCRRDRWVAVALPGSQPLQGWVRIEDCL